MWTPAARAQLARPAEPYATCLTSAEWAIAEPFLPPPEPRGRRRRWPMRLLLDTMLYVLRTGCAWRHLPRDFPPWQTVLRWFLRLADGGGGGRADRPLGWRRRGGAAWGCDAARRVVARTRHALARDREATPSSAFAFFVLAAAAVLLRRLAWAQYNGRSG